MELSSEMIGWIVGGIGAVWIGYKEWWLKRQDAKIEKGKIITEAQIDRDKAKDILESNTQKTTLEAYTNLNDKVFGLFETIVGNMQGKVDKIEQDTSTLRNFADTFDKAHDEILDRVRGMEDRGCGNDPCGK